MKKAFENLSLQDIEGEVWKDIKDFEGYYQISNMGRVKSLERKIWINHLNGYYKTINEIIMKQSKKYKDKNRNNRMFSICYEGLHYSYNTARLVYKNFGKNKNIKNKLVLHKDLNCGNNSIENLYLGDYEDLSNIISKNSKGKNKYKGVSIIKEKYRKRIRMSIRIDNKLIWETCKTELEGAELYDFYIKKYNLKREGNFINK